MKKNDFFVSKYQAQIFEKAKSNIAEDYTWEYWNMMPESFKDFVCSLYYLFWLSVPSTDDKDLIMKLNLPFSLRFPGMEKYSISNAAIQVGINMIIDIMPAMKQLLEESKRENNEFKELTYNRLYETYKFMILYGFDLNMSFYSMKIKSKFKKPFMPIFDDIAKAMNIEKKLIFTIKKK